MAKATRAEREMEQILQICALRDELRVVREELDKTCAELAKADNELNAAAYDLERQGRELAEARLDSARLDFALKFMNEQRLFAWFLERYRCRLQSSRGEADLDEWRKWIDEARVPQ